MVDAVVHWLHLMAAILWVGGTLAVSLVVHPALRQGVDEAARMKLYAALGRRFSALQWTTWGVLLATGSWKLWELRGVPGIFFSGFGRVLAVKLTLVAAMVGLSLAHSIWWGPALTAGGLRPDERAVLARKAARWGKVNGMLMASIVFCAVLLRFQPW
jgi:putative copper export protein